jgi:hypothetical protein
LQIDVGVVMGLGDDDNEAQEGPDWPKARPTNVQMV